jgi:hypothetical protein
MPAALGPGLDSRPIIAEKIDPDLISQPDGPLEPPLVFMAKFHILSPSCPVSKKRAKKNPKKQV